MKANLTNLTRGMDGNFQLTISLPDPNVKTVWHNLHDHDVEVEIKKYRKKRSRDANNFCWALCTDIGRALYPPIPKEEVYRKVIREVGVYVPIQIREDEVETFCQRWEEKKGTGWFVDVVDDSMQNGYKLVHAYYGSSTYNTKEMSVLIDMLVSDAESMGLPIPLGKDEMEKLKREWRNG